MRVTRGLPKALQRSEHDEQVALFRWAALSVIQHPSLSLMFAVPNGARTAISVAKRLKAEGLKKGVPDVVLPVPRGKYHGLFLELKREGATPSSITPEQFAWHKALVAEGYYVAAVFGFESARRTILEYLNLEQP